MARAWSGYVDSLLGGQISNLTQSLFGDYYSGFFSEHPDLLSSLVCVFYSVILGKYSKISNNFHNESSTFTILSILQLLALRVPP